MTGQRTQHEHFGSSRVRAPLPRLAVCRTCGLAWQDPMPDVQVITGAYERLRDEEYLHETQNRRCAANAVLRALERYVGPTEGPLLDVGCSTGLLLDVAATRGWDVWGIEPSHWLSEHARRKFGLRIQTATLDSADLAGRYFAAITLVDVLEHVHDPAAFLRRVSGALAPDGVVVFNVPRRDGVIARLLGSRWPLLLPEHLYYFSLPSLRHLLRVAGLDLVEHGRRPVVFSLGYVASRLAQHRWPGAAALARTAELAGAHGAPVPLLMGELLGIAQHIAKR
ncbi:MAG: class I SAM-dependent methyltransferase [Polyangiaceae bacterium]|nr:class I SAM-dependent methyltransferase [Polyangiaceae bacterium]